MKKKLLLILLLTCIGCIYPVRGETEIGDLSVEETIDCIRTRVRLGMIQAEALQQCRDGENLPALANDTSTPVSQISVCSAYKQPEAPDSLTSEKAAKADSSEPEEAQSIDWKPWLDRVRAAVEDRWQAGETRISTSTIVQFHIKPDGSIFNICILESSNNRDLDQTAVRAVQSAHPLPPTPEAFTGERVQINYTFDINIR